MHLLASHMGTRASLPAGQGGRRGAGGGGATHVGMSFRKASSLMRALLQLLALNFTNSAFWVPVMTREGMASKYLL